MKILLIIALFVIVMPYLAYKTILSAMLELDCDCTVNHDEVMGDSSEQ